MALAQRSRAFHTGPRPRALYLALVASLGLTVGGLSGCAENFPTPSCSSNAECPSGTYCGFGECVEDVVSADVDATGAWWMLRYHYAFPAGMTPVLDDVTGVSFEVINNTFTQFFDGQTEGIPGTIQASGQYVQTDGDFRAALSFTDADHGTGAFEQGDFVFDMEMVRKGAPAFNIAGRWEELGGSGMVEFTVAGDTVEMHVDGTRFAGRIARDRALLVADPVIPQAAVSASLTWSSAQSATLVVYTTEWFEGGAVGQSQRSYTLIPAVDVPVGDVERPTVLSRFPAGSDGSFYPDAPIEVTFSEPIDRDSVTTSTFIVHPLSPVGGREFAENEGIPGTFEFAGNTVAFLPDRGGLYAYRTRYTISLTDGITDLAGNPLVPPAPLTITTLLLQPNAEYRVIFEDGRWLTTRTDPSGTEQLALVDPRDAGPRAVWTAEWVDGLAELSFSNVEFDDAIDGRSFVEFGDGTAPAFMAGSELFTGQIAELISRGPRDPSGPYESPETYRISSRWQGPDRAAAPIPGPDDSAFSLVSMRDSVGEGEGWYFERLSEDREVSCADVDANACGNFACWMPDRMCLTWCFDPDQCVEGARCEDGVCVDTP